MVYIILNRFDYNWLDYTPVCTSNANFRFLAGVFRTQAGYELTRMLQVSRRAGGAVESIVGNKVSRTTHNWQFLLIGEYH